MLQTAVALGVSECVYACMCVCVCEWIFAPLNAAIAEEVTLNLMRTQYFYFILFVFNFGLLSAFYMGASFYILYVRLLLLLLRFPFAFV